MNRNRAFCFVGPDRLRVLAGDEIFRHRLTADTSLDDLFSGLGGIDNRGSEITLTYVVDDAHNLWVADRHSEHIACARGAAVLAAGELTLDFSGRTVEVVAASDQSTGYCPDPECFSSLARALDAINIERPDGFDPEFQFGRCRNCEALAIIKDDDLQCVECGGQLGPVHG